MIKPALPANEKERIQALKRFRILDTPEEIEFDQLVALASQICESEISLISLIDESRQWFKAKKGLDANETDRDFAICAHAIHESEIFEIEDTLQDERFYDNPLVLDDPRIRFYAGMPLETADGFKLGTLCVIDSNPKRLNEFQRNALRILGRQAIKLMELRIKNQDLERNIEIRNRLLSVVAHDLKGPVKSIGVLAGFIDPDEMDSEEIKEASHEIELAANRAVELIENLLNWARNISSDESIEHTTFSISKILAEIQELYAPMLNSKKLKLEYSTSLDVVKGDNEMIRFILRNLVGNAIKFSEHGHIQVDVESVGITAWQFKVTDQGIGMTESQLAKLFDWEKRFTTPGTQNEKGTGIGLLLCQEFIALHQGNLKIETELGKGTSFIVNLMQS
ncbi:MAG: ATP-binding protein [Bacteroidia bacterium]